MTRKGDREAAAAAAKRFAAEHGLDYSDWQHDREIHCTLRRGGLAVHFSFEPLCEKIGHLGHWVSKDRLPTDFPVESRNKYHGRKATTIRYSVRTLLLAIERGFDHARR